MIVLCLNDKVLGQVSKEKITIHGESSVNQILSKHYMHIRWVLKRQIVNEFNKLILNMKNIDVQIDNEHQTLVLWDSLPKMYDHLKKHYYLKRKLFLFRRFMLSKLNEKFNIKGCGNRVGFVPKEYKTILHRGGSCYSKLNEKFNVR